MSQLRSQYEQYPYPPRNPDDEKKRLVRTSLDFLPKISHFCFRGQLNLKQPFEILVAGGGTGDSAIYLAEQVRHGPTRIDYLDFSKQSLEVAKKRAEIRKLENIVFRHGSILEVADIFEKKYSYINCSGVLHHMPDPNAGLSALANVLKPEGAIGIMVYAQYGRTAVYQTQTLLRKIVGGMPLGRQLELGKKLLSKLPETNWQQRSADLHIDHHELGDAGFADLFLNSCDRAFTVPEIYDWLSSAELYFTAYASNRLHYKPEMYISDAQILEAIKHKTQREQETIAELISGAMIKHTFYAGLEPKKPAKLEPGMVPILPAEIDSAALSKRLKGMKIGQFELLATHDAKLNLPVNPISQLFFQYLTQNKSLQEISRKIIDHPSLHQFPDQWVQNEILELCKLLLSADMLYLNRTIN